MYLMAKHDLCLLVQCEMDPETGEPTDTLAPLAKNMIESLGSRCTTVSSVIDSKDRAVFTAITEGLERANQEATSNAQRVCTVCFYIPHTCTCGLYACYVYYVCTR